MLELTATPAQLAEVKLLVPQIDQRINAFQLDTIASNMDFLLTPDVTVRQYLHLLVSSGTTSADELVEIVRTVRMTQLRPRMDAAVDRAIEQHGYAVQSVFAQDDKPAFAYTIGLTEEVGFELMALAGYDHELLAHLVGSYADLAKAHEHIEQERNDVIEMAATPGYGVRTKCIPVEARVATADFVKQTRGDVVRVYQILIADKNNLFPDEQGYSKTWPQPRLPRPLV